MSNENHQTENNEFQKIKKEETIKVENLNFLVFKLNAQLEKFEELKIAESDKLENLLDHDEILIFIDNLNSRVWIWEGKNTPPRMKFMSADFAPIIRDQYACDYNITTIDDGDEPIEFKIILGLELEV